MVHITTESILKPSWEVNGFEKFILLEGGVLGSVRCGALTCGQKFFFTKIFTDGDVAYGIMQAKIYFLDVDHNHPAPSCPNSKQITLKMAPLVLVF